ncbi:MAG TPA: RHS repeat-associated core domain-containing protein [candidate division Zixibacteria bacterium]|nr:RHS repeat-associated core domain-containing protein [candidate division Zixibacteria bacterium]
MYYDALGNLVADSAKGLDSMYYDYRNLVTRAVQPPNTIPGVNCTVDCSYDHTGQRIMKKYRYNYWTECDDDTVPGIEFGVNSLPELGGVTTEAIGGGGGTLCVKQNTVYTYYLYEGSTLIATFDQDDDVIDLYVNGPSGRIATFHENDNAQLNYFIGDHLGSTRIVMNDPSGIFDTAAVVQFYNYYPYGGTMEAWGNYKTDMRFTGKEKDDEGSFDYYYFGARYYDSDLGRFTSIDKASQFASGFVYCANNPVSMVDQDGNWAVAALAWALKAYAAYSAAKQVGNIYNAFKYGGRDAGWSALGLALMSQAEGKLLGCIGGLKGHGIRFGYNSARQGKWDVGGLAFTAGTTLANIGAAKLDAWTASWGAASPSTVAPSSSDGDGELPPSVLSASSVEADALWGKYHDTRETVITSFMADAGQFVHDEHIGEKLACVRTTIEFTQILAAHESASSDPMKFPTAFEGAMKDDGITQTRSANELYDDISSSGEWSACAESRVGDLVNSGHLVVAAQKGDVLPGGQQLSGHLDVVLPGAVQNPSRSGSFQAGVHINPTTLCNSEPGLAEAWKPDHNKASFSYKRPPEYFLYTRWRMPKPPLLWLSAASAH